MDIALLISGQNLLDWSYMEDWVDGAASAPTGHVLTGVDATVAREATIIKIGTYSAKVTRVGNNATLYAAITDYDNYKGRKVTFGAWVYATVADRARLSVSDGVGSTESSYHTGGSSWEYLTVTHDIDTSATQLRAEMQVNTGNTAAYFDAGVMCLGDSAITIITDYAKIGDWKTINKYISQTYEVPRREGSKIPNMRIDSKSISASADVVGTTLTAKRTAFDALMKVMNAYIIKPNGDIDLKNVYFYDDRYYKCFADKIDPDEKAGGRMTGLSLRFNIPEPFMWDANKTRVNESLAGTATFTVSNTGSAPTRPVITVTNDSSNITSVIVENLTTGQKVSYSGTLATGKDLVIDCENLTVKNDGTNDLGNVTNEIGIVIIPGDNEIKVTGIVSGDIDIDFFKRWY